MFFYLLQFEKMDIIPTYEIIIATFLIIKNLLKVFGNKKI